MSFRAFRAPDARLRQKIVCDTGHRRQESAPQPGKREALAVPASVAAE
jgi:hypothetical protein